MPEIDYVNIVQLQPVQRPTWAVYAPWPLLPSETVPDPAYSVVDHGDAETSKYHAGDYWDSRYDPPPTRSERERHGNFLGWALEPEGKWSQQERQLWQEKAWAYVLAVMERRKDRVVVSAPQLQST